MTETPSSGDARTAQAVITLKVAPGSEAEFSALEGRLGAACQTFPGFLASEIVQPVAGVQDHWALRVRFASPEHLQAWLDSETRRRLLTLPLFGHMTDEQLDFVADRLVAAI